MKQFFPSLLFSHRVVTEDCYPYQSPLEAPAEVGRCMMQSRSVGRGKRQATQRCPNTHNYHNDIYQSTPPYRLSSNVSSAHTLNSTWCSHTDSPHTLMLTLQRNTTCFNLQWTFSCTFLGCPLATLDCNLSQVCFCTFYHAFLTALRMNMIKCSTALFTESVKGKEFNFYEI